MRGTIFNIQKFCVNDGPGIRTTVFLKGCPLDCMWCHNPESKETQRELFYNQSKCIGCGACAAVCSEHCHDLTETHRYNRAECIRCGACADACPTGAMELVGKDVSVEEVLAEVEKDALFYRNSGGGMTVSGGEPMMQFAFTMELLRQGKKRGLHTAMETCGFASAERYREIAPLVDLFLFDYKLTDPEQHCKYTGVRNELILENLGMLDSMGAKIVLRCPIIPGINDHDDHFAGVAKLANKLKMIQGVEIEPYHPLGSGKAQMLDKAYPLEKLTFPDQGTVTTWIQKIQRMTSVTVKKG